MGIIHGKPSTKLSTTANLKTLKVVSRKESLKAVSEAVINLKSHCHKPYPSCNSSFQKTPTSDKSFRPSNKPSDSEHLPPLCLACAQLGHTFPNCPDSSSSNLLTHSKVVNKQLVQQANTDIRYCIDFNIFNGERVCTKCIHKRGEIHTCSLCRSTEHSACSPKCLGA